MIWSTMFAAVLSVALDTRPITSWTPMMTPVTAAIGPMFFQ